MPSRRGFTLVELLLVLVLISLAAGMMALSFGGSSQWETLKHDASSFHTLCRYARLTAVSQSKQVRVEIDALRRTYKLTVETDDNPDVFEQPEGAWRETLTWDENIAVTPVQRKTGDQTLTFIAFFPDGTADPVDVMLTHPSFKERLRVSVSDLTGTSALETVYEE